MKHLLAVVGLILMSVSFALANGYENQFFEDGSLKTEFRQLGEDTYKVIYYFEDGTVRETGYFRNGMNHGVWMTFNREGVLVGEGYYNENRKEGKWRFWNENGLVVAEVEYMDNIMLDEYNLAGK